MERLGYKSRGINKLYRIRDLVTGQYIRLGYAQKSSWNSFPSQVIKNNIDESDYSKYQIDMFETNPSKSFTLDRKEI